MDAVIKVSSSEFNQELFNKIGNLLKGRDADVTIAVREKSISSVVNEEQYWANLDKSIADIEQGKGVTFSMQELEKFINK